MRHAPAGPDRSRYELVDALRGFALCGVLLANLSSFSLYAYLPQSTRAALASADFDAAAGVALEWLLHHKAVTVFALLFGFGFAMQLERAQAAGEGLRPYLRRMAVLLALGALHTLAWWGDILLVYALGGLLLPLFLRCPDRWLPWLGLAIALPVTAALRMWFMAHAAAWPVATPQVLQAAGEALASPSAGAALRGNLSLLRWWLPIGAVMLVAFSLGRFLLGLWAARRGLLQDPGRHRALLLRILAWTLPLGVAATALQSSMDRLKAAWPWLSGDGSGALVAGMVSFAGPLLLGIAIAAGFVLLYQREGWRRWLRHFAPAGRMALTHYLVQTLACSAVFYGYGLGLGPWYGTPAWFVAWVALFGAQLLASRWWLARFRYGPMEWLWRSLALARPQPMRVASGDAR